jgi:electron transfer flavoprotein alpha subunit
MENVYVINEKCTMCKLCIKECLVNAISIKESKVNINDKCVLCGTCVSICKSNAIILNNKKHTEVYDIKNYKGVWVFGEQNKGELSEVALELLGEGRRLADKLGVDLSIILLGYKISDTIDKLIAHGADNVFIVDDPIVERFNDEIYSDIVAQLIDENKPEIFLIGATTYGSSLAPRVATRIGTGLTADCTNLEIDTDRRLLLQTRPTFGGSLMATIICPNHRPQMSTVKTNVMKPIEPDYTRSGNVIRTKVTMNYNVGSKIIESYNGIFSNVNLNDAKIIVGIGRGVEKLETLKLIQEFAACLGATIGASRGLVETGLVESQYQIGQTGLTVSPKIYFACGISGATQHIVGMLSSEIIIAINKDPNAPIFKIADIGIVGDITQVISELTKQFKLKETIAR